MIALTGLLRTIPAESFWGRFQPSIDLGPHQAIFFLTEKSHALHRVELSGADEKTVLAEPDCHGLIVTRDFGVRLTTPCHFEGGLAGEVETEVRLRCLDNAAEWPRWIAQGRSEPLVGEDASPDRSFARLVAGLFEAELVRLFATQPYREVSRRLNDPSLVAQVETQVRAALSRWSDERVVGLVAVHLLKIHSAEGERLERSEVEALQAQARLEREHRLRLLAAKQAAELAALEPAAAVKWEKQPEPPAAVEPGRPSPPRMATAAERQETIQRVLGGLGGAQPPTVRVWVLAWAGVRPSSVADLIRSTPEGSSTVRLGDEIHVVIESAVAGYLHVFNLGTSGEVSEMMPDRFQPPVRVESYQAYVVSTGAAIAPLASAGAPISPWVEQGPANGYPERILAVVTEESRLLSANELSPAWSGAPASATGSGTGFGAPQVEATLSARPTAGWAWGLAEVAVVP